MMYEEKENFILEVIPYNLKQSLTSVDSIIYKDKKLRCDYLIDIISNIFILSNIRNNDGFKIQATTYKKRYGAYYNYYIQYMIDNDIIKLKKNYFVGVNPRIYILNPHVANDTISFYKNINKNLIKKKITCPTSFNPHNNIDDDIKHMMVDDLYKVSIDYDKALKILSDDGDDTCKNSITTYMIETIKNDEWFYHFDNYGRLHTNITILKSQIRDNCLKINNNEIVGFDIKNSQPFFFTKFLSDYIKKDSETIDHQELIQYFNDTKNGILYDKFVGLSYTLNKRVVKITDRKMAKKIIYKVLFGKNVGAYYDVLFSSFYPTIYKAIKKYKQKNDYKSIAQMLQRIESNLIFNNIIREIKNINPNINLFTVHDSIYVELQYNDVVKKIFNNNIKSFFDEQLKKINRIKK